MSIVKENFFYCKVTVNKCKKMLPEIINFYDLTFVLKGSLTYNINGKKYILNENDAIFLKPNTLRERLTGNHTVEYVSFNFFLNEDINIDVFLKDIISMDIKKLIYLIPQSHISVSFHSKEKIESILNYILYEIIDNSEFKSQNQHIVKILKYIEDNLSQSLTLSQISNHVNLTKEYTANLFKKEIGKTIIDYINERKMIIAKNMIDNGGVCLKDVAISLGFENYSYFSKLFKKYYKTSPIKRKNS